MDRRLARRLAGALLVVLALVVGTVLVLDDPDHPDVAVDEAPDELITGDFEVYQDQAETIEGEAVLETTEKTRKRKPRKRKLRLLRCRVVDPDDQPVEGAKVFVRPQAWSFWTDHEQEPTAERKTDADGRCAFSLPNTGRYTLEATHDDYAMVRAGTYAIGDDVVLRLQPARTIRGAVFDDEGERVADARVRAIDDRGTASLTAPVVIHAEVRSDAEGNFVLQVPRGKRRVSASKPGYAGRSVWVSASDEKAVHLVLKRRETVRLRVVSDATGDPIPDAAVSAASGLAKAQTDADGWATLVGVRTTHRYARVHVRADGYAPVVVPASSVDGSTVRLQPGVLVTGRILFGDRMIRDADVRIFDADDQYRAHNALQTGVDGRFSVRAVPDGYLVVRVRLDRDSYVVRTVDVPSADGDIGLIDLTTGAAAFGSVELPPGLTRCKVSIRARIPGLSRRAYLSTQQSATITPERVSFRFPGLTVSGEYTVALSCSGWPQLEKRIEVDGADVGPLVFAFPSLVTLRGRTVDHDGKPVTRGVSIDSYRSGQRVVISTTPNVRGWFELHLPPHKDGAPGSPYNDLYHPHVSASSDWEGSTAFWVTHRLGKTPTLVVPGPDDISGRVAGSGGSWWNAGVVTIEAWSNGEKIATTRSDPQNQNQFVFYDIPPGGVDLRVAGERFSGRLDDVPRGSHRLKLEVRR